MHKQREEDRISGALRKPSAEDEFDSRVRESEVSERRVKRVWSAISCHHHKKNEQAGGTVISSWVG